MYILLKTNIYHIFFLFFYCVRALMLGFTVAKHLEQLSVLFFFGTILCYGISALEEEEMGQKKIIIIIINFMSTDTVPCIKLK